MLLSKNYCSCLWNNTVCLNVVNCEHTHGEGFDASDAQVQYINYIAERNRTPRRTSMSSNTPNDQTTPRAPGGVVPPITPPTPTARNQPPRSPSHESTVPRGWKLVETHKSADDGVGPFARYDEFTCRSLAHLIGTGLHPGPRYHDADKKNKSLASTKELSSTELTLREDLQLTRIVFAPNMLAPLMKLVKTELSSLELRFEERIHSDFVPAVSAWHTFLGLSRRVNSEKDVEDWVGRVILAPALHVVLALREKVIPDLHHDEQATFPLRHLMREGGPYVASAPTKGSIPDAVVVDDREEIKGTAEVKTENVLRQDSTYHSHQHGGILGPVLEPHQVNGQPTLGRAVKFIWPTDSSSHSNEEDKSDSQTRILVQVRSI